MKTTKRADPTIDRIRRVRHEISEHFDHDPQKLVAHYIEFQQQFGKRLLAKPQDHETDRTPT